MCFEEGSRSSLSSWIVLSLTGIVIHSHPHPWPLRSVSDFYLWWHTVHPLCITHCGPYFWSLRSLICVTWYSWQWWCMYKDEWNSKNHLLCHVMDAQDIHFIIKTYKTLALSCYGSQDIHFIIKTYVLLLLFYY